MERNKASPDDYTNYNGSVTMDEITENLRNLVKAIKNSKEYIEYITAQKELEKDPAKKAKVDAYRNRQFYIQNNYTGAQMYQNLDTLFEETMNFREDEQIDDFLRKELALCRVVQKVGLTVVEELNFDIDFIEPHDLYHPAEQ